MEGFADEAENRLDQDLLQLASGNRTRDLQRRLKKYQNFIAAADTANTEFALKYKERILNAATTTAGVVTYVPGAEIDGDELRTFADDPIISGPLVCQLCDADFISEKSFTEHKKDCHAGECEYRKRVLYLMEEQGCRPITAQEKRIMVQNFAHFQQYCYPGAMGNYFAEGEEVPRCEAACAICARKDWLEHRFKLRLFAEPPAATVSEDAAAEADPEEEELDEDCKRFEATPRTPAKLKRHGQYYIQSPQLVHQLLDVNRYAQRWPLIPPQELHASSIEHPSQKDSDGNNFRWLLHTRRVPVLPTLPAASDSGVAQPADATSGAAQPAASVPVCAGVGDPEAYVWACWDCLNDLCAKKPKMPLNGLTNDNWIGREKVHVREASKATKMLASLGRCCWKQVRLGKGAPDVQQKGISGNTIFSPSQLLTSLRWSCHLL